MRQRGALVVEVVVVSSAQAIRSIFDAPDLAKAQERLKEVVKQFQPKAPKLADWIENNVPEGLTVLGLPQSHQRRMRTSNSAERLNQELKRRTRVVRVFPNDASLLRLVTALLVEQSDGWETEKTYLNMKTRNEYPYYTHLAKLIILQK